MRKIFFVVFIMLFLFADSAFARGTSSGSGFRFFRNLLNQDKDSCDCAWDKILDEDRFKVIMNGEAVLDKETCLVWELEPNTSPMEWEDARAYCYRLTLGGRGGWRMPTIEELRSLLDIVNPSPLPEENPFILGSQVGFWSTTTVATGISDAWIVDTGIPNARAWSKLQPVHIWCVRGGQGYDGR